MDVTPLIPQDQKIIQSYAGGRFRISGEFFTTPVLVGAGFVRPWQGMTVLSADDAAQFAPMAGEIDVLLIGAGASTPLLLPVVRQSFKVLGLQVEVMDTGAACRTFNVLSAEGRRVAAALMPI